MFETESRPDGSVHLDIKSVGEWMASRPPLLRAFLASGQPMDSALCQNLANKVSVGVDDISNIIPAICEDLDGTIALGRPGRFRLMAWMADAEKNSAEPLLPVLVGDKISPEVKVPAQICALFHNDLLQFASTVIAPQAEMALTSPSIIAALEAGVSALPSGPTPPEPIASPVPGNTF